MYMYNHPVNTDTKLGCGGAVVSTSDSQSMGRGCVLADSI